MSEEGKILVAGGAVERRVNRLLAVMLGFLIGGGLMFAFLLERVHHNAVTNCRQVEVVKHGLMGIFAEAQQLTEQNKTNSPTQKAEAVKFFRDALGQLKPRQC